MSYTSFTPTGYPDNPLYWSDRAGQTNESLGDGYKYPENYVEGNPGPAIFLDFYQSSKWEDYKTWLNGDASN